MNDDERRGAQVAAAVAAVLYLVTVLRMGWVSDDAFIAIRSVDNLVHGQGFTVNVLERVQSYTSPLWALLCVPFFAATQSPYAALILPGLVCSLGLVVVLIRGLCATPWRSVVVLVALAVSSSFVHFSTSGLENALGHLLLALFVLDRLRGPEPTRAGFVLAAGLFLTRFDYVLLVGPAVLLAVAKHPRGSVRLAWPALVAAGAWLLFATFYYGSPLPNTAYAKTNTAIPLGERLAQGAAYLVDSAARDPIVLLALGVAGLLAAGRGAGSAERALMAGAGAYLLYVVYVGGDFMSGRFLTPCTLMAVMVAVHLAASRSDRMLPVAAAALALLVPATFMDRRAHLARTDCAVPMSGIVDERECYVDFTGLTQNIRRQKWRTHGYLRDFQKAVKATRDPFVVFDLAGMVSYANRRQVHIVERFALTEPLLARIRFEPDEKWRVGHYFRPLPVGYEETLRSGDNLIEDPCVRDLYDRLVLATRAPLWAPGRLGAIWELNTTHRTCDAP
jgi:arabinofuranosyltransferase